MKKLLSILTLATLASSAGLAQSNTATQQVSINVAEIAVIAVQGNISMTIDAATAGEAPDPATASSTYNVTTNGSDKKITGQLDVDMPSGLTLTAAMDAPGTASSAGKLSLSSTAIDLVTGITRVKGKQLGLSYEARATVNAEPDNYSRTVTYTITNN